MVHLPLLRHPLHVCCHILLENQMKCTTAVLEVAGYIFHPHRALLHLMGVLYGVQWDVNQAPNETTFCVYIYGAVC